jgi:uncharacterized phage protein gp47/JayE
MALSLFDLQTPVSRESVRAYLEGLLIAEGFPVTAWQPESAARAFLELQAQAGAQQSVPVAALAKMGFLSTSEADFLTALVKSNYDEDRTPAVATVLPVSMINASATTYVKGAREIVIQARNGRNFYNTAAASVTANATTSVSFTAELAGAAGNIPGQDLTLVTPLAGVTARFSGSLTTSGADEEGDPQIRERASSKWATLRIEKINPGIVNLARNAAPSVHGVAIDDENPRGPGTLDVYLAADNATAGAADVALVQTALNGALFGTGTAEVAGLAIAAPTLVLDLAMTVYVRGLSAVDATAALAAAWTAFLLTVPVGGFDLSPGPQNVILPDQITDWMGAIPGVIASSVTLPTADPILVPLYTKVLEGSVAFNVVVLGT